MIPAPPLVQYSISNWCTSRNKRALDIIVAVLALVITAPLMLLIAVVIRCTSFGPALFRQWRWGLNQRPFQLLKFRTMENTITEAGPGVTRSGDPRVTRLGKWLRRWKLDELPQFINVLRGEMSIVGPRPDLEQFWRQATDVERHALAIKPGLTSAATLAFVNEEELLAHVPESEVVRFYVRDLLPRKAHMDCEYAAQANFLSDCRLLLKTIARIPFPSIKQARRRSIQVRARTSRSSAVTRKCSVDPGCESRTDHRPQTSNASPDNGRDEKNSLKILFITPYFPPEIGAPQTRIYEQAVRLGSKGHIVSILTTFPNYPSGIVPGEWKGRLFWRGSEQGVGVYRFWTYTAPNSEFFRRIVSQLSFALLACIAALRVPPADVLIIESPPLFNGISACIVGWIKRAPYVLHVSDLWPETAIQLGALKNPVLIWLSRRIEALSYRRAAMVLAVTIGIQLSIAAEVGTEKVMVLRNAVDTDFFRPDVDGMDLRKRLGVSDKHFLVLYAGTLGLAQQLDAALESAALFQNEGSTVHFVFAGDGAEKESLQRKASEMKLSNVNFLAPFAKSCMPQLLKEADCVFVSLRDLPIFHAALPTKLFEAMACARPVVLAGAGEAESLVRASAAGCCARPGNAQSIHDAILRVHLHPDEAEEMARKGREYMLANFSRERRVEELLSILRQFTPQALPSLHLPTEIRSA